MLVSGVDMMEVLGGNLLSITFRLVKNKETYCKICLNDFSVFYFIPRKLS